MKLSNQGNKLCALHCSSVRLEQKIPMSKKLYLFVALFLHLFVRPSGTRRFPNLFKKRFPKKLQKIAKRFLFKIPKKKILNFFFQKSFKTMFQKEIQEKNLKKFEKEINSNKISNLYIFKKSK